jgi:dTDP-4-amino-4,6-dideoxygalactose transaminase
LPYTERMFTRCLMLPMNTSLTDADVNYVCDVIESFYAKGKSAPGAEAVRHV